MRRLPTFFLYLAAAFILWSCGGGGGGGGSTTVFEVLIENVSPRDSLPGGAAVVFSSGVLAVHDSPAPIFTAGQPARSNGLESMAEDGNTTALLEALSLVDGVSLLAVVQTPVGEQSSTILGPGQSYRALVRAAPGSNLSLILSFLQGNDLFVSPGDQGIALFDAGDNPISADVTSSIQLFDAGTEVNQPPGQGSDQSVRQEDINTGASEANPVAPVADGFSYPSVNSMIRVTVRPQ